MATIGKIRKHSGLLIGLVGLAIVAFVLQDYLGSRNGNRELEPIAEVYGEDLSYNDFLQRVEDHKILYTLINNSNEFSSSDLFKINNEVYDMMVKNALMEEEYDELGLAVSDAELAEFFTGKFVHPLVQRLFSDPNTGAFNVSQVQMYIDDYENKPAEEKMRWNMIERVILEERRTQKYVSLVTKGYYMPKAFLDRDNVSKNKKYVTTYTVLPYATIDDSKITVTDEELEKYYEDHKYEYYYEEPVAALDYVIFNVKPSKTDYSKAQTQVDSLFSVFKGTNNEGMGSFIGAYSSAGFLWDSSYVRRDVLPVKADSLFNSPIGSVVQPYMENDVYAMHKLMDRKVLPDSLKSAHILVSYKGAPNAAQTVTRTKAQAKQKADSLLAVVNGKDSANFAEVAKKNSDDPSVKTNAGFAGWIIEGSFPKKYNDVCVESALGSCQIAETDFGYFVIRVMDRTKPIDKIKMATLSIMVEPSRATTDSIYSNAIGFATETPTFWVFDKNVAAKGLNKSVANPVRTSDFTIPGINEGRSLVQWAFAETTCAGMISTVMSFDEDSKYVVAVLRDVHQKGQASFEDVKLFITPFAKKEKKAQQLTEKMNGALKGVSSVSQLASKLSTEVDTFDVSFSSLSLPGGGNEPEVIAAIAAAKKGVISKPVKGEMGVYVFTVTSIVEAPKADYKMLAGQKNNEFQAKMNKQLFKSLEDAAEVKDNRVMKY